MNSLAIGDVLDDRYRIDRPIARGGMSMVYRCVDMRLGRAVAAKVMHDHLAQDPVFHQRFTREARAMAQLSHPNLIAVHDFSAPSDPAEPVFLVMELITGGTLRELLAERGPMPPHAATAVMRAVLQGLSAVHARGLIHRDIKPDNVLINADHRVKLGDFGLVRAAQAEHVTTDQIVGTVSYLAPEQVTGGKLTPATDVYSAGIVLYELLTGEVPFTGDTPLNKATARLHADVPSPSSRIAGVPRLFDALVASATAREPEDRFADAAEFLAALDDVAAELELPAFTVPVPKRSAAGAAAAQPTNFTGVSTPGSDSVFEPTRTIPAEPDADATQVLGDGDGADNPTTVMAPAPMSEETLAGWEAPTVGDEAAHAQPRLSFDTGGFETRADLGVQPVAGMPVMPAPTPEAPLVPVNRTPQTAVYPAQQPQPVQQAQPAQPAQPVQPAPTTIAEEEPAPRLYSNRSPVGLVLWLLFVAVLTVAVAIGGWSFASGNYAQLPALWW